MSATLRADPGPLARFATIAEDPTTMGLIVARVADGETLKDIAKAWQVPYSKLSQWIVEDRERSEGYSGALMLRADALAQESIGIADGAAEEPGAVQKAKLQIDTRLKLAGKLHRPRYGDATEVKHTGSVSLIAVLSSLPRGRTVDVTPAIEETSLEKIPQRKVEELI